MPVTPKAQYPEDVRLLEKLGGKAELSGLLDASGQPIQGAGERVTFGDLHQIRNFIRSKVDWAT